MDPSLYWLGVVLAILSGIINNFGTVLQKKVVNDHIDDKEFMKNLAKNPLWLLGLIMQLAIGTVFFIFAQIYIGPALIPGLMAGGLIILALGSVKIVGESLKKPEIIGIFIMIIGITVLGLSELSIEITEVDLFEQWFILRLIIFTFLCFMSSVICYIWQMKNEKFRAILIAVSSGFMFSLSNFWISPLMGVFTNVFGGNVSIEELMLFIVAAIILVLANILGTWMIQKAFKFGQASNVIPIQQVPMQITPIIVYYLVFLLASPSILSAFYSIIAVVLIVISSFLLGQRQAQLEEIKKE